MNHLIETGSRAGPWNKGKPVGQKAPLRLKDIWAIRIRLQLGSRIRELALFNLAIDCKLRSCDLVKLRVRDLLHGERIAARAIWPSSIAPALIYLPLLVGTMAPAMVLVNYFVYYCVPPARRAKAS